MPAAADLCTIGINMITDQQKTTSNVQIDGDTYLWPSVRKTQDVVDIVSDVHIEGPGQVPWLTDPMVV